MKQIRWGIIGAGNISSTLATALNGMNDVVLEAVASRDLKKSIEFSEKHGFKKAYGSYEELVADDDVDVIYIGTPHTEHLKNAAMCIKAGKAVLCEKPFTINEEDTSYLINLAKQHKVFLMEAMWTKFLPVTKAVKAWIDEGRIGTVKYLDIKFGFMKEFEEKHRLFNPALGGGALLDVGIYPITYAVFMLGQLPQKIVSSAILGRSDVDELNSILFEFKDGEIASLSSSIVAEIGKDAVIVGNKGKIVIKDFWMAQRAFLYDRDNNKIDQIEHKHIINGYEYEIAEVNSCLRQGKLESTSNTLQDTIKIMKILDLLRNQWGIKYPTENSDK